MRTLLKASACVMLVLLVMGAVARADITIDNTLDLTTAGATASGNAFLGGTFWVQQIEPRSTGSGVIESFLRINGNNNPSEAGYNVAQGDANKLLDDVAGGFTVLLPLADVPIVTFEGASYRQFMLDINQEKNDNLLSLNQVQIFLGAAASTSYGGKPCDSGTNSSISGNCTVVPFITLSGLTQVFAMNDNTGGTTETNHVLLNYALNTGSGSGDMFLYVPAGLFGDQQYVTLFSQFGDPTGTSQQNDGYEEWAVTTAGPVPEPTTLMLFGSGLLAIGGAVRRKIRSGAVK